jgi:hypothetical protein
MLFRKIYRDTIVTKIHVGITKKGFTKRGKLSVILCLSFFLISNEDDGRMYLPGLKNRNF